MTISNGVKLYDGAFYDNQMEGSYRSAKLYVAHILNVLKPRSVADVGCGRGTWLKAFGEQGVKRLVGFDGEWNSQEKMIEQSVEFIPADLNKPFVDVAEKFDLALSLEVAEHLHEDSAEVFVKNMTSLSDIIVFGAAFTKQGGTDHINEQPPSYWAKMFIDAGYAPYDFFRERFWGDENVEFWYQQNTFLYIKNTSKLNQDLQKGGFQPISNVRFMDCVHPILYEFWVGEASIPVRNQIKRLLSKIIPFRA